MKKTILITGATDGIGLETAKLLAAEGHHLLLHGRNAEKLRQAAADIDGAVDTYLADLSRLSEVSNLAQAIKAQHARLDVLINNAGVYKTPNTQTADGLDVRFMVNTLAPFALTQDLLPVIPPQGRIVNLSSAAQAPVAIDALMGQTQIGDMDAYAQSKLAITIWSRDLAKTLPEGPMVLAVNPGSLLASKMVKEGFGVAGNDLSIGADILRRAALSEEFTGKSGAYFDNDSGRIANPHGAALDTDHAAAVMGAIQETLAKLS